MVSATILRDVFPHVLCCNCVAILTPARVLFAFGTQPDGSNNTLYNDAGLMGETVWAELLNDLRAENFTSEATKLESIMKERSQYWSTQADPYGSEQAWDCTGQEGVYLWTK